MRLTTLLAPTLLAGLAVLPGCAYVGSPFDGFGMFVSDTHGFRRGPNSPPGDSPNMRRVSGREIDTEPLTPEPGNVWPGPQPADPTLADLQRQQNDPNNRPSSYSAPSAAPPPQPAPGGATRATPRGSSTQPPLAQIPTQRAPTPTLPDQSAPPSREISTPQGPGFINPGSGGVQTYTAPGGGVGIVVPNGNGTNTLIGPDGSVSTAPRQR